MTSTCLNLWCIRALHRTIRSLVAAYRDIAEELLQRIASGEPAAGSALPSVRATAGVRDTTAATVGRAYAELARAGVIELAPRRAARVSRDGAMLARRALHGGRALRLAGSDDPLLDRIAGGADRVGAPGSFGGLTALWQQRADAATLHLRHRDGGYNDRSRRTSSPAAGPSSSISGAASRASCCRAAIPMA